MRYTTAGPWLDEVSALVGTPRSGAAPAPGAPRPARGDPRQIVGQAIRGRTRHVRHVGRPIARPPIAVLAGGAARDANQGGHAPHEREPAARSLAGAVRCTGWRAVELSVARGNRSATV